MRINQSINQEDYPRITEMAMLAYRVKDYKDATMPFDKQVSLVHPGFTSRRQWRQFERSTASQFSRYRFFCIYEIVQSS